MYILKFLSLTFADGLQNKYDLHQISQNCNAVCNVDFILFKNKILNWDHVMRQEHEFVRIHQNEENCSIIFYGAK